MIRYIFFIITFLQITESSVEDSYIKQDKIQLITNKKDNFFYKTLLKKYFVSLPSNMTISFAIDNNADTRSNMGTICINKTLKKVIISSDVFCIYNKGDKFFLKDKELDELN